MKTKKTPHGYQVIGTKWTVRKQPRTSSLSCGWEIGQVMGGSFHPTRWTYSKKSALQKLAEEEGS